MDLYQQWLIYALLFGVLVIIIWVAQTLNKRKSEKRRIAIKQGPKVDRFIDPGKAVSPDTIYTKEESRIKAAQWWERSGLPQGICGVCNTQVSKPDGYLVSLKMVAASRSYLEIAAKPIMEFGLPRDQAMAQAKEQLLKDNAPWLVCDECRDHFF